AWRRRPHLKVLYTTGYARNAIVLHGRLDHGAQLITKPFTFAELAAKVRQVLNVKGRRQALLVENQAQVSALVADALRELGFDVIEAATAKAAMESAKTDIDNLDLAVVHLGLPDESGDELVASLRALRANLPIIVAPEYGHEALPERLRNADRLFV